MQIEQLLKQQYSLDKVRVTYLEGYETSTCKVSCSQGKFIFKTYPFNVKTRALLETESNVLEQLGHLSEYHFPAVLPSKNGKLLEIEDSTLCRLLTFVEGDFLGDIEHTQKIQQSFGAFLARMDSVLLSLDDLVIQSKESRWDLRYLRLNYELLDYIPDAADRNLVDYFFLQFDDQVVPVQDKLRRAIIHNDANDWNVLTSDGQISGIIDFGDMCHSWLINELAVGLTYIMIDKKDPLEVARNVISRYHEILPLQELELDILYYLIAARLCMSVCNSAYTKTLKPKSDYVTISEKPAWNLLRKWLTINPTRAKNVFRLAAGFKAEVRSSQADLLERRKSNFSSSLSLSYDDPILMERSAFQYMYDHEGNAILDAYNNIMLAGHCHPKVVRAARRQMAQLNTNTRYLYDVLQAYGEKLLARFPDSLNKVFFVNSGSAATDLALRLAHAYTSSKKIMVLEHGYHGNTRACIEISHYKYSKEGGIGKPAHVLEAPMPKAFGTSFKDEGEAGVFFAEKALEQLEEKGEKVGALITEPIMGCGGQVPLAQGFLKHLYPRIKAQGGVCISDEVQVGFGRLGDVFWGYELHDVVPDLVILGKPMGNGHPIGAVVCTNEIAGSFEKGPEFFSSFGGNPVSCATGLAVLEAIEEEELQKQAKIVGDYLMTQLKGLQEEFTAIADVRGRGLFIGVELQDENGNPGTKLAAEIKNQLRQAHILVSTDGPFDNVLKIKPPLSFNKENAIELISGIRMILQVLIKH